MSQYEQLALLLWYALYDLNSKLNIHDLGFVKDAPENLSAESLKMVLNQCSLKTKMPQIGAGGPILHLFSGIFWF